MNKDYRPTAEELATYRRDVIETVECPVCTAAKRKPCLKLTAEHDQRDQTSWTATGAAVAYVHDDRSLYYINYLGLS